MNQTQLATAIGVTPSAISQLERDISTTPSAQTLMELARVLRASPEWIQHGTGAMELEVGAQPEEGELLEAWRGLSAGQQRALISAMRALAAPPADKK
mgnify:CR=1 FL=1